MSQPPVRPVHLGKARILLFDIECTSLKSDFGFVLCIGYKWFGEKKVYCPTLRFPFTHANFRQEERRLIRFFQKIFEQADVIVTYNGIRFDVPYIQAKLIEHRRKGDYYILPNTEHVDLYWHIKKKLPVISRKSLANVCYYFNLPEKTPVEGRIWMAAQMGSPKAMRYIVKHCKADVLALEAGYEVIRPLIRQHPRVSGYGPCRNCGSTRIHSKGCYTTKNKGGRRRTRCVDCGSWNDLIEKDFKALEASRYTHRNGKRDGKSQEVRKTKRGKAA